MRTLRSSRDSKPQELQTELTAKHVMQVFKFLASKLSREEREKLVELADSDVAGDEPPDFSGKPLADGGRQPARHGMDARRSRRVESSAYASYAEMFPDAERVRVLW